MSGKLDLSKPIQTKGGQPVRVLASDFDNPKFPLVVAIAFTNGELLRTYTKNGTYYEDGRDDSYNLINVPEKKEGWGYLYKLSYRGGSTKFETNGKFLFPSEAIALNHYKSFEKTRDLIKTVKIEWEE